MSAFLGPVHHWMYGKIQLQEELTNRLVTLSEDSTLAKQLEETYGLTDAKPLELIIDQSNIHGWLNSRVERAENRFADAVEALQEQVDFELLTRATQAFGQEHAIPGHTNIADGYRAIDSVLLDGMPCDGGRRIVNEDEDELVFQYEMELHALCQRSAAGAAAFVVLRGCLLKGMLENSGLKLESLGGGTYRLSKEE